MKHNNLNEFSALIFKGNLSRGFHEKPQETGTYLMLMVSELSEALEADRKGNKFFGNIDEILKTPEQHYADNFRANVKDTLEDELADALIRILDYCGLKGIDIEKHVAAKLRYNATRPYKHGKKY